MDIVLYNKLLSIKNDPLANWKYALNRVKNNNVIIDISCIGDSITQGAGSDIDQSLWMTRGFVGQLRTYFANKYGNVGIGTVPVYAVAESAPQYNPWTYSGSGWADTIGVYGFMGCCKKSTAINDTATIQFNGTGVSVILAKNDQSTTVSFTLTVDGVDHAYTLGTSTAMIPLQEFKITGLTDGSHTLVVKHTVDTTTMYLIGIYEIKGNKGIRVNMMGQSGKSISQATASDYVMQASIDLFAPKLTIISMLANDYTGNTDLGTYKTKMETLIKRAKQTGDVLLLTTGMRSDGGRYNFEGYVNTVKGLADTYNCVLIDIYEAWGLSFDYAKNTLQYIYDTVHPNYTGHTDIVNRIIQKIDL